MVCLLLFRCRDVGVVAYLGLGSWVLGAESGVTGIRASRFGHGLGVERQGLRLETKRTGAALDVDIGLSVVVGT